MQLKITNLNVRYLNDRDGNRINKRAPRILEAFENFDPDILTLQEYTSDIKNALNSTLAQKYNIYTLANGWRNFNTVLWRKGKFKILKTGFISLSDSPKEYVTSWDNFYRYASYIILKDRETEKCFTVMSVHIGITEECHIKSAKLICEYAKKISDYPTVICGTFNFNPDTEAYKIMCGEYVDINAVTAKDWRTTYHEYLPEQFPDRHYDYCFISKGIEPVSHRIMDESFPHERELPPYSTKYTTAYLSDHYGLENIIKI